MPLADPIHRGIRGLDSVIALEIPHHPDWTHVIRPAQVQDLLHNLVRRLVLLVVGDRPPPCQPLISRLPVPLAP